MNNARLASFTSLSLKIVGGVLIVSALVDYALVAFPLMPLENAWQISFTNQVVSRGNQPLLGIMALLLGSWIDLSVGKKADLKASVTDLRFLSFIVSLILGAIFFLIIPLHIDNMQSLRDEALSKIEQESQQSEQQVQAQFNQLQALAQNPEAKKQLDEQIKAIDAALNAGQVPPQQIAEAQAKKQELADFQRFANDPNALSGRLEELKNKVVEARDKQRKDAENNVLRETLQTSLRSLLLGIGYLVIGWLGIQNSFMSGTKATYAAPEIPVTTQNIPKASESPASEAASEEE